MIKINFRGIVLGCFVVLFFSFTLSAQNTALNFDGIDDHVVIGNSPIDLNFDGLKPFTMEAWIRPTSYASGNNLPIVSKYDIGGFGADYMFGVSSLGHLKFTREPITYATSSNVIPLLIYTHVAVTFDGLTIRFFINGILNKEIAVVFNPIVSTSAPVLIGCENVGSANQNEFTGDIDEVRIWNYARDCGALLAYKDVELTGTDLGLVAYYNFNSGATPSGNNSIFTSLTDLSSNVYTGTLTNFLPLTGSTSNWVDGSANGLSTGLPLLYPEAVLKGNSIEIPSLVNIPSIFDATYFGDEIVGSGLKDVVFEMHNTGTGFLLLTGGANLVTISGSSDFTVLNDAASATLSVGTNTAFTIRFTPTSIGVKTAVVTIKNNDCDEDVYSFTIEGNGKAPSATTAGAALDFDGMDNYIALANSSDFNYETSDSFTVELWFKTQSSAPQEVLFSTLTNAPSYKGYELYLDKGNVVFFMCSDVSISEYFTLTTSNLYDDNLWHHIAVVYKGIPSAKDVDIYIDGSIALVNPSNNSALGSIKNSNSAHIGARGNSGQTYFYKGQLDDLRIWNRALCGLEVSAGYLCERSGLEAGLVAYYPFNVGLASGNNGAVTILPDSAGLDNNGVLTGFDLSGSISNFITPGGVVSGTSCGVLVEPEINIKGNSINILTGSTTTAVANNTDFGLMQIGGSLSHLFVVENTGGAGAALNFSSKPFVTIIGDPDFKLAVGKLPTAIMSGAQTSFNIVFNPSSPGVKNAIISIKSDDCSEPDYQYAISGTGDVVMLPSYILVGPSSILVNQLARYSISPELPSNYNYAWKYSDKSLYRIEDTTRYFMDVVANRQTNNGVLTCIIFKEGIAFDTVDLNLSINQNFINFAELTVLEPSCAAVYNAANKCEQNYIDYFKLQDINYDNNGCSIGGYQDLTATNYTTDLEMGNVYNVELKPLKLYFIPNPNAPLAPDTVTLFYAIWIDYNNDGDFEDAYEFVKTGESRSTLAKLINISIANNKLYEGSRRMRVGMRSGVGFTANEACAIVGESGELEDYIVTLIPMRQLEGPNLLTPNDDGNNDVLTIKGIDTDKSKELTVFTKGGVIVYVDNSYNNDWGGIDKEGKVLPKGTYYYILKNGSSEFRTFLELDY